MCAAKQDGAFRRQDTQILVEDAHPREQWDERCPEAWEGYNLRAAWREGRRLRFVTAEQDSDNSYARYHEPSGMVLIAEYGFIHTCVRRE